MRLADRHTFVGRSRWTIRGIILAIVTGLFGVPVQADEPVAPTPLIQEAWRSSPFHGAINGATGNPIPCICRYREREFKLGEKVCLSTPNGTVLARCDLAQNNTSWVPTTEQCTIS